jgi:t-SNARE complex subunit (syntaxin)
VKSFWQVQNEIKTTQKDQLKRQYKIARPAASDQEIEHAIESGRTDVFGQELLSSRVEEQRRMLGAVQDRQLALDRILKTMEELVELTQELEGLINVRKDSVDKQPLKKGLFILILVTPSFFFILFFLSFLFY